MTTKVNVTPELNADELMRGDFLRYKQDFPDTHLQGKIVNVCGVRGRVDVRTIDDGVFHESEHPDWLEPIPLSPEILEKNFGSVGSNDIPYISILVNGNFHSKMIHSVHELQHALKLCGVEKEIVL